MAKRNTKESKKTQSDSIKAHKNPLLPAFLVLLAICLFLSVISFEPSALHVIGSLDAVVQSDDQTVPLLGKFGNYLAYYNLALLGVSSWLLPWALICLAYSIYYKTSIIFKCKKVGSVLLFIISICAFSDLNFSESFNKQYFISGPGGYLGCFLYSGLPFTSTIGVPQGIIGAFFGPLGTYLLSIILSVFSLLLHFSLSISTIRGLYAKIPLLKLPRSKEAKSETLDQTTIMEKKPSSAKSLFSKLLSAMPKLNVNAEDDLLFSDVSKSQTAKETNVHGELIKPKSSFKPMKAKNKEQANHNDNAIEVKAVEGVTSDSNLTSESLEENLVPAEITRSNQVEMDGFKVVRAAKTEKAGDLFPERKGDYQFPTLDLLMEPPEEVGNADDDHMEKARNLKETLAQFKVDVELGEVHTGPVITRYDVHPAAGVRVEKIANLDKNLAMALRADSVRILAPVPGKGCVGIEVPNSDPAAVCLKEILQSKAWADSGAEIPIVLGKEASGKALVADLTKMPHLLVAGSTGSGKTVCINAIIASLCYHSSPEDVRFIMVDPKIVEMKIYNDLPHMLIPVVTEPKKVPGALKWLLIEMERRYQIFSKVGVRNIAGFNAKILKDKEEKEKAQLLDAEMTAEERAALSNIQVPRDDDALEIPENKLPYIVCIIDELADLMMVAQADVETGIARLAQLARAAGIHLIIATQRPSVNVITGVIKANLPSRISFRVASYRDSQTILDGKGAEALIGRGDMLFIPPGSATFVRAQGAFVSDDEINGIVDYLKINGPPEIIEEVREQIESAGEDDVLGQGGDDGDEDPMVRKAIEVIRTTKRASTSNLQRKLSIGYNRAARIMDDLEDRGMIGPDVPGQGREILMDL
ncbi:MAG: DNA translocase FtsK [Opitutales bacterium]|nr:DNA translocase FtsK [Opitutales bacterium]